MTDRSKTLEVMARQYCADECRGHRVTACNPCRHWDIYSEEAERLLTALQAEGMAVVPVEPTPAMLDAAEPCMDDYGSYGHREELAKAYSAMLSASPYGKASQPMGSAEAQSAVANSPSIKAGKEESK